MQPRHIQNFSEAATLEPHWGYVSRALPCTNDAGSCAYLDLVYASHDQSMLYSGIIWITILGIVSGLAVYTRVYHSSLSTGDSDGRSAWNRLPRAIFSSLRRHLLPDAWRPVFGGATRLQVTILLVLVGYLIIWTFVGMTYQQWITPVKNKPGVYNTRTTIGPLADRVGVLAYALTPLSVLLGNRESLLSILTGIPYQKFNFLHRWLGWIIFLQSVLHTVGWCIVEIRLYQPQPTVARDWIVQTYMIWGLVAMSLLTILVLLSTPWAIRLTGYEFFRKAHYVLAMVYIGACWGHWEQLKCFLLPSLLLWFLDRGARLVRTALLHYQLLETGDFGFRPAQARFKSFENRVDGDVLRLEFELDQDHWHIGQHYYLCFPDSSIWQSHPFTPLNIPRVVDGKVRHSYILRAKHGETKRLAELARHQDTTSVVLTGPYGERLLDSITPSMNVLCIAGGTGITYVLPLLLELAARSDLSHGRQIELIWSVRHADDSLWIQEELDMLRRSPKVKIRLYATRDCRCGLRCDCGSSIDEKTIQVNVLNESEDDDGITSAHDACESATKMSDNSMSSGRPNINNLLRTFVDQTNAGRSIVVASGPSGMLGDTRKVVARCNSGKQVWKGQQKHDIELVCDDRLEW